MTGSQPRVAILLDGEFVKKVLQKSLKRFPGDTDIQAVCTTARQHVALANADLYRVFYYTADPLSSGSATNPIDRSVVNFAASPVARLNEALISKLELLPNFSVRRGELILTGWKLGRFAVKRLKKNPLQPIAAKDLVPEIHQKGVDMRIGLDISALALKRLVTDIVLVTGDTDMIPAMKFARREGLRVYLHTVGAPVKRNLKVHADVLIP